MGPGYETKENLKVMPPWKEILLKKKEFNSFSILR